MQDIPQLDREQLRGKRDQVDTSCRSGEDDADKPVEILDRRTCSASHGMPSAVSRARSTCRSWSMCATASTTSGISATGCHKHSPRTRLNARHQQADYEFTHLSTK